MENINQLPNEILSEIFSYLTPHERQCQRQVCKRWKQNIDYIYGVNLVFTERNFEEAQSIDQRDVVSLILKNLNKTVKKKMVHQRVRSITFVNLIWKRNLLSLLKVLPNLSKISFNGPCFINFRKLKPTKNFVFPPNLTEMNFTFSVATMDETKNYFLLMTLFSELGVLGRLKKLKVLLIGDVDNFLIYSSMGNLGDKKDPIGQMILNNKGTLKELELYNVYQIYSNEYYRDPKFAEIKADKLVVYEMDGRSSWTELLYGQNCLHTLELIVNLQMWKSNVIQGSVCMSKNTLEVFRVLIHKDDDEPTKHFVDLKFLVVCTKLKKLSVTTEGLRTRQLYQFLPNSLIELNIDGLVDQDTLQDLFDIPTSFPHLMMFTLQRYLWWQWQPYPATQSITARTIYYIAQQPKLTKIKLYSCKLNRNQIVQMLRYAVGIEGHISFSGDLHLEIDREAFMQGFRYYVPNTRILEI